jgi:SAM-dependent methyltransferase
MNVANIRACYPGGETPIQHIFDFGCGFGRVTRWIRAGFPDAKVYVTDYDKAGVAWCVEQYGCIDAGQDITPDTYDMIWLGSVFTHLASDVVEPLMQRLLRSLRPNGVLVITSQGRFAEKRIEAFDWTNDEKAFVHYGLKKELTDILLEDYNRTGYGYVDYPGQKGYGVCIAKSQWYTDRVTSSPDYIHILSQEKGSDNHQDVNAYMRANLLDEEKGPLW